MLAVPPDEMKVRLHNEAPSSTSLAAQTKPKYGVVLFQLELSPAFLCFSDQVPDFMAVVHLMASVGGALINFHPSKLFELLEWGVNDGVPFFFAPFAGLTPRPTISPVCLRDAPSYVRAEAASILDSFGSFLGF